MVDGGLLFLQGVARKLVMHVTATTREQVQFLEAFGTLTNTELNKCERGNRIFAIGDRCELHGLEEYPELNGEVVVITAYRESANGLNGYYIRSESGAVERWLNYVWEKRLRLCERPTS